MPKLRKIIYILFFGYFFMSLIADVWLEGSYSSDLPKVPDAKTGHTYRMVVNHGFVVYGSEREFHNLRMVKNSLPIAAIFFMPAVIMGLMCGDFPIKPGRKINE
jgi:hypothetical protein